MFKMITEFIIDRETLLKSEYGHYDKVSMIDGADQTDIAPEEMIASILAKLIEEGDVV